MAKVTVVGAGSWGIALAKLLAFFMLPFRIRFPVVFIVPPFSSMTIGCEAVIAVNVFSVPLFLNVMVLPASPSEPYCEPSLFARYVAVRVPLLMMVPPLYLFTFLILTSPLPSMESVPSPSIAPSPDRVYVFVLFLKRHLGRNRLQWWPEW